MKSSGVGYVDRSLGAVDSSSSTVCRVVLSLEHSVKICAESRLIVKITRGKASA